jgi:FkbM family methyltransferase
MLGIRWFPAWIAYALGPLIRRLGGGGRVRFAGFTARIGDTDLYTFANLFADYDVSLLDRSLEQVTAVIDAGANVGAFSWLVLARAASVKRPIKIKAVEPNPRTFEALKAQPFASQLECIQAAVGPESGVCTLIPSTSSASSRVSFSRGDGEEVPMIAFADLVEGPTLIKMDIEGAESHVLRQALPEGVIAMFLEMHADAKGCAHPSDYVPNGRWIPLSRDVFGSTTWFWTRA